MLTYTSERYDSSGGAPFESTTTEFKFSDGTRFVRIYEEAFRDGQPARRTRVLRSDFEGDKEHRSSIKELRSYIDRAEAVIMQVEPPAPARTTPMLFTVKVLRENEETVGDDVVAKRITSQYETALSAIVEHLTGVFGFRADAARNIANQALERARPLYIVATIPGWTMTVEVKA